MNKNTSSPTGRGFQRDGAKEQFWRQIVKGFPNSGQTVHAYCSEHQVSEPSFYAWRRTLAQRDAARARLAGPAPAKPTFVPVRLAGAVSDPGPSSAASVIEVVLPGGRCVRVRGPVDRVALAEVVAVLEGLTTVEPAAR